MILAVKEGLLEKLTADKVPNLAKLRPGAIHMEGMWANYVVPWQGIAYNTKALPNGIASWSEVWDPKFKGRVILPSLQNTEGLANLFIASHLATGKPMVEALKDPDAGFKHLAKLKPNLLTVYTQMPQAFNLLEQGEAWVIVSALSSFALQRKSQGAPIDLAAPKEGIFASPSGICMVKGAPAADLAYAYVNEMLGAELQGKIAGPTFSLPTNTAVSPPAGHADQRDPAWPRLGLCRRQPDGVGQPLGSRDGDLSLRSAGASVRPLAGGRASRVRRWGMTGTTDFLSITEAEKSFAATRVLTPRQSRSEARRVRLPAGAFGLWQDNAICASSLACFHRMPETCGSTART